MALKRNTEEVRIEEDTIAKKARQLFTEDEAPAKKQKEKMSLTTFSIKPSEKAELEELFQSLYGLGWSAGIRMALKEFLRKHKNGDV